MCAPGGWQWLSQWSGCLRLTKAVSHELAQVLGSLLLGGRGLGLWRWRRAVVEAVDLRQVLKSHSRPPKQPAVDHKNLAVNYAAGPRGGKCEVGHTAMQPREGNSERAEGGQRGSLVWIMGM